MQWKFANRKQDTVHVNVLNNRRDPPSVEIRLVRIALMVPGGLRSSLKKISVHNEDLIQVK